MQIHLYKTTYPPDPVITGDSVGTSGVFSSFKMAQLKCVKTRLLTMSASVLVSFNAIFVKPFILGLEGSLSDNTITSGEGTLFSLFISLPIKRKRQRTSQ